MTARPVIIYPVTASGELLIKKLDGDCSVYEADRHNGETYDLIIPGQMVRAHYHALPKLREREKLAAARFAIEEHIASATDAQHIAFGHSTDAARLSVIDANYLQNALDDMQSRDVSIMDVYADYDWVAPQSSPIRLDDRFIFTANESGETGYTIDPHWADAELSALPVTDWSQLTPRVDAVSLRQGAFSKGGNFSLPTHQLSKIAAVLLIVSASWLGLQWSESRAIAAQASELKALTAQTYTNATGQPAPANPALSVTRAVKSGAGSGPEFMSVLGQLNATLTQTENITVQSLDYDPESGALSLRLIYPNFESASALQNAARQTGANFNPGGVRERNNQLIGEGRFTIGGPS